MTLRNEVLLLEVERQQTGKRNVIYFKNAYQSIGLFSKTFLDNMIEMARYQRNMQINEQLFLLISQQAAETAVWEQTQSGLARG